MSATTYAIRPVRDYSGTGSRLAVRLGAALVRWAELRTARRVVDHERRSVLVAAERALAERERRALAPLGPVVR